MSTRASRKASRRLALQKAQGAAAHYAASRPLFQEFGSTGLKLSGGLVVEDYNADLRAPAWYDVAARMLRGDGQCKAMKMVVGLPVRSVAWRVDPNERRNSRDLQIADELHDNLFNGMTSTFGNLLAHAVSAAMIGCYYLEPVWEDRDGAIRLRKLAPRHPRNIKQYLTDDTGGLQGIVYNVYNPTTRLTVAKTIPIEYLLRFTWDEEDGNFEGNALLRPSYKHWWHSDTYYKISSIGIERFWIPTIVGILAQGANEQDKSTYLSLLQSIRVSDRGAIVLPSGYEMPQFVQGAGGNGGGRVPDILNLIEHHQQQIARSVLAQFLQLGSTTTGIGSNALSESQVEFFIMCINAIADWIAETVNRYLIPKWVLYNYPGYDAFPRLSHGSIARLIKASKMMEAIAHLVAGKMITPGDRDTENVIREAFDLPPAPERDPGDITQDEENQDSEETDPGADPGSASRGSRPRAASSSRTRQRPRNDRHWDETQARLTAAKDDFQRDAGALVTRQHEALQKKLQPLIDAYHAAPDLEKGNHIRAMQQVEVPLVGSYQDLVAAWMKRFYEKACAAAAESAGVEAPTTIPNATRTWIQTKAQVIAQQHAEALRAAVLHEVLEGVRRNLPTKKIVWNMAQVSRNRTSRDLYDSLIAEAEHSLLPLVEDIFSEGDEA